MLKKKLMTLGSASALAAITLCACGAGQSNAGANSITTATKTDNSSVDSAAKGAKTTAPTTANKEDKSPSGKPSASPKSSPGTKDIATVSPTSSPTPIKTSPRVIKTKKINQEPRTRTITKTYLVTKTLKAAPKPKGPKKVLPRRKAIAPSASPSITPEKATNAPQGRFTDSVTGILRDPTSVPCGGLWEYSIGGPGNFYAREIACAGSQRYFSMQGGAKINIGSKTCRYKAFQDLNYLKHNVENISWAGNTLIQICKPSGPGVAEGDARIFNFDCS